MVTLILLSSCQSAPNTPYLLKTDESLATYQYTIGSEEDPLTLTVPLLEKKDSAEPLNNSPLYSLNPLVENKAGRGLTDSTFYKNDEVDTYTKDRAYNFARYGFGFWVLNDSGKAKSSQGTLLTKTDYALLFGDFYHDNDFNNSDYVKYYIATQELIWESMVNPETGNPFVIEFTDIDISNEKQQILNAIEEYGKTPFFNGSVINVTNDKLESGEPYELKDTHGVLPRYKVEATDDIELLDSEDPNTLRFNLKDVSRTTKISFIPEFQIKQEFSQVYSSSDNVSYLSIGQERALNTVSSLHFEKVQPTNSLTLVITTHDIDNKEVQLYGAQYQVSTGPEFLDPKASTVSSEELPSLFENLAPGTYYIQQTKAPEGYILNQEVEEVSIAGGIQEFTYPVYNQKK